MPFEKITLNKKNIDILKKQFASGRVAHAYIFFGLEKTEKRETAIEFSKLLNCLNPTSDIDSCESCQNCLLIDKNIHPDVHIIDLAWQANYLGKSLSRQKNISIETVRFIEAKTSLKPVMANYKVFIVDDADKMSTEAMDSFLKTLEEPAGNTVIILIAKNLEVFPQTVISRCQLLKFTPSGKEFITESELTQSFQDLFTKLTQKDLPVHELISTKKISLNINRETMKEFVQYLLHNLQHNKKICELLMQFEQSLNYNINLSIFFDYLLLKLKRELNDSG